MRNSNASSSCLSSYVSLPTILICRMRARSPSLILIAIRTLFPGTSSTSVVTLAAYLPWLKYWSVSDCSTSSITERSKVLPAFRPICASGSSRSSVLMSLLPSIVNDSIEGRSDTAMISVPSSHRISTSLKKPVPYTARVASWTRWRSSVSPMLTGR